MRRVAIVAVTVALGVALAAAGAPAAERGAGRRNGGAPGAAPGWTPGAMDPDSLARVVAQARRLAADSLAADSIMARVQSGAAGDSLSPAVSGRSRGRSASDTTTARRRRGPREPTGWDQPRLVMLRSLVFPGWGQFHNKAYWKAGAVAGVEGYLIGRLFADESRLGRLSDQANRAQQAGDQDGYANAVTAYNTLLDASVSRAWLLGGVVAYAMLDAYVDAHFVDFDIQFREDPALQGHGAGARARLGLRWRF